MASTDWSWKLRENFALSLPASWSNFFSLAHSPVCQKATTRTAARYISVVCPICPLLIPHIPLRGENADVIEFVYGAHGLEVGRVGFLCHSLMVTLPHFLPLSSVSHFRPPRTLHSIRLAPILLLQCLTSFLPNIPYFLPTFPAFFPPHMTDDLSK